MARPKGSAQEPTPETVASLRKIGLAIRRARNARGWSQEELGGRADVNHSNIGPIEAGTQNVQFHTLHRIAEALDGTVEIRLPAKRKSYADVTSKPAGAVHEPRTGKKARS